MPDETPADRVDPKTVDETQQYVSAGDVNDAKPKVEETADFEGASTHPEAKGEINVAIGSRFGRYEIEKELGRGAMGAVFLARDTKLDRQVALKVPKFGPDASEANVSRFHREARSMATLSHPNLCPVYDVDEIDGIHFLTMQFVDGQPLDEVMAGEKTFPPEQVASTLQKLALALEEAHHAGVVHRDLKPANIMIDRRGEPIIMDFGLAQRRAENEVTLTHSGQVIGTPAYMSPEQVRGNHDQIGPASDVYALGVIGYQMLTGRRPFCGSFGEVMAGILKETPPSPSELNPQVDSEIDSICMKAMAKSLDARYRSANEFAANLHDYVQTLSSSPTLTQPASEVMETARPTQAKRKSMKRRLVVAFAILFVAGLAGKLFSPKKQLVSQSLEAAVGAAHAKSETNATKSSSKNKGDKAGLLPTVPTIDDSETASIEKHGLSFSGQSIVSASDFPFDGTQSFCLEAYLRPFRVDGEHWILEYCSGVRLMISESDWLGFVSQSMTHQVFVDEFPQANERYHVAFVRDGDQIQLFVNGQGGRKNSLSDAAIRTGGNTRLQIGRLFEGVIESVRVSHVVRYQNDFTPQPLTDDADTVALYSFNEGEGATAADSSRNNHTGTIVDASWVELGQSESTQP